MKILIKPEDIVRRCLWNSFAYYIVGTEKESQKILEENKEFEISEEDALVIGLLKVIETDNLIHKFNSHIKDVLTNKTKKVNNKLLVNKNVLESSIDTFMANFPDYWEIPLNYKKNLEDLLDYVEVYKEGLDKLEIHSHEDRNIKFEMYSSNSVKKLLKFNY